jgi:hypothetical protein
MLMEMQIDEGAKKKQKTCYAKYTPEAPKRQNRSLNMA